MTRPGKFPERIFCYCPFCGKTWATVAYQPGATGNWNCDCGAHLEVVQNGAGGFATIKGAAS